MEMPLPSKWCHQFRVIKELQTNICVRISLKKIECSISPFPFATLLYYFSNGWSTGTVVHFL